MNEDKKFQQTFTELKDFLDNNNSEAFREHFLDLHIYDQSRFFRDLDKSDRTKLYSILAPKEMADLFDLFDTDDMDVEPYLEEMNLDYTAEVFDEMYRDNAADLVESLKPEKSREILAKMKPDNALQIKQILHYDQDTAGSLMTTEFVSISANQTVKSAMTVLKAQAEEAETIYYVYVI